MPDMSTKSSFDVPQVKSYLGNRKGKRSEPLRSQTLDHSGKRIGINRPEWDQEFITATAPEGPETDQAVVGQLPDNFVKHRLGDIDLRQKIIRQLIHARREVEDEQDVSGTGPRLTRSSSEGTT